MAGAPAACGGRPAFHEKFRFIRPLLPNLDPVITTYVQAYNNAVITNAELVARLEAAAAERLGAMHCVAVSSCTSGLMMVLRALGLTGEVILPSFTFFATGHAVRWNGLKPVLSRPSFFRPRATPVPKALAPWFLAAHSTNTVRSRQRVAFWQHGRCSVRGSLALVRYSRYPLAGACR